MNEKLNVKSSVTAVMVLWNGEIWYWQRHSIRLYQDIKWEPKVIYAASVKKRMAVLFQINLYLVLTWIFIHVRWWTFRHGDFIWWQKIQMIYIVPDKIILLQNQRKRSGEPSGIMRTLMQKWYIIMWHQRNFKGWKCPAVVLGKHVQSGLNYNGSIYIMFIHSNWWKWEIVVIRQTEKRH